MEFAFSIAGATSSGDSTRMPTQPIDSAHLTKSGHSVEQVDLAVALVVEHLLPLADHAEIAVVEQRDLDRDALDRGGDELLGGHLEATVAVDGPHRLVGPAHLGADRGRDREAHRAEATRVDPGVRLLELPVQRRPHLVLTDTRREDRALGGGVAELLEAVLRLERGTRLALLVRGRELSPASRRCGSSTDPGRAATTPPSLQRLGSP